ncbi:MAG: CPBP family intramembrane metalloprotease [Lachnospiraceae bacterium]|nr:CPBP family intramembrane metalloprotease [Lachnospiraceae bacterium]
MDSEITENKITQKRTIIFCIITFVLTWSLMSVIPLTGMEYGVSLESLLIMEVCMFMPTLGNVLTRLATKQGFSDFKLAPKFKGNGKNYLFAYFSFIILIYLGVVVYYLIYREQFSFAQAFMFNQEENLVSMQIIVNIAVSTAISPIINVIPTLGEEIGWRGYLLYGLKNSCGSVKAVLLTGIIWGIWHAPVIAMGHNYGKDYPGYPFVGILMMIVFCVAVGIIEGYLTLRTDSVLPAAICHSAINGLAGIGISFCNATQINVLAGPTYVGIIPLIPTVLFDAYILYKIKKEAM